MIFEHIEDRYLEPRDKTEYSDIVCACCEETLLVGKMYVRMHDVCYCEDCISYNTHFAEPKEI